MRGVISMTYEDLWLYVNNQYTNAMQAGMLGTDIVISKEDYFSLLEICNGWDIRCTPVILGFNSVTYIEKDGKLDPEPHCMLLEGIQCACDDYLRVILEWDEDKTREDDIFEIIWYPEDEREDKDDEEEI